jgi:hypothetical protein
MGTRRRLTSAVLGALALIVLTAIPSSAANPTTTPVRTAPDIVELYPAAVAGYVAWEQNSVRSPNHFDVFAQPRSGGLRWKVNAPRTFGFGSSPVSGTQAIIYQQAAGSASDLYQYNLSSKRRVKLPAKVNTAAWEYSGTASSSNIAFMRLTPTARVLWLYNRSTRRTTQIASIKPKCGSCLRPTWVGASHLLYQTCSAKTFGCQIRLWTKGVATRVVPNADGSPYSQYGGSMNEATGDVYYIRTTTWCGLFTEIRRWNIAGGSFTTIYDFPEGTDANSVSLAPDELTPSDTDLLFSQFDCIANESDIYQIASVNLL